MANIIGDCVTSKGIIYAGTLKIKPISTIIGDCITGKDIIITGSIKTIPVPRIIDSVVTIELKKELSFKAEPISICCTGFFIDDMGTVLTNNHVVSRMTQTDHARVICNDKQYSFNPWPGRA